MGQHPQGERIEVRHACPECPTPLAGGIYIPPNGLCVWCRGAGLVSTEDLARWQWDRLQTMPT